MSETAPLRQHGDSRSETPKSPHSPTHSAVSSDPPGATIFSLRVPASVESVPYARHVVRRAIPPDIPAEPQDILELLVSELVTNAVQHAPQSSTVTVEILRATHTLVRITVTDAGSPLPRPRRPADSRDENGRGLLLVEALAQAWGSRPIAGGKVVWCDVAVTG